MDGTIEQWASAIIFHIKEIDLIWHGNRMRLATRTWRPTSFISADGFQSDLTCQGWIVKILILKLLLANWNVVKIYIQENCQCSLLQPPYLDQLKPIHSIIPPPPADPFVSFPLQTAVSNQELPSLLNLSSELPSYHADRLVISSSTAGMAKMNDIYSVI